MEQSIPFSRVYRPVHLSPPAVLTSHDDTARGHQALPLSRVPGDSTSPAIDLTSRNLSSLPPRSEHSPRHRWNLGQTLSKMLRSSLDGEAREMERDRSPLTRTQPAPAEARVPSPEMTPRRLPERHVAKNQSCAAVPSASQMTSRIDTGGGFLRRSRRQSQSESFASRTYWRILGRMTSVLVTIVAATLAGVVGGQSQKCDNMDLKKCMNELNVLSNNHDLAFAHTEEELSTVCRHLKDALSCVNRFTGRCFNREQQEAYKMLTTGAQELLLDLCTNNTEFRRKYLKYAPCFSKLSDEYKYCNDDYQIQQETISSQKMDAEVQLQMSCCIFDKYKQCTRSAVLSKCGSDAAKLGEQIVEKAGGPLIQNHCSKYKYDSPYCSLGVSLAVSSALLLIAVASTVGKAISFL